MFFQCVKAIFEISATLKTVGSLFLQSKMMQIFLLRYDMLGVYIKQLFSHESEKISLNESMDSVYGNFSFIEVWALSHFDQHERNTSAGCESYLNVFLYSGFLLVSAKVVKNASTEDQIALSLNKHRSLQK